MSWLLTIFLGLLAAFVVALIVTAIAAGIRDDIRDTRQDRHRTTLWRIRMLEQDLLDYHGNLLPFDKWLDRQPKPLPGRDRPIRK